MRLGGLFSDDLSSLYKVLHDLNFMITVEFYDLNFTLGSNKEQVEIPFSTGFAGLV